MNQFVTRIEDIDLVDVHPMDNCAGEPCVIHNPTDHHMREWPLHWRNDRVLFERICPHGVGHPDPDQFAFWDRMAAKGYAMYEAMGVHGCDGCCRA